MRKVCQLRPKHTWGECLRSQIWTVPQKVSIKKNSFSLYKSKCFTLPPMYSRSHVGSAWQIFSFRFWDGPAGKKSLYVVWGRWREKYAKNSIGTASEALRRNNGWGGAVILLWGGRAIEAFHLFEGQSEMLEMCWRSLVYRPKICTDDVSYTHFSRENVALKRFFFSLPPLAH
jgi:hypothetical protein